MEVESEKKDKACYDNPLFEDDNRFKPDGTVNGVHKKDSRSNDYKISADDTAEPEIHFQKDQLRRRKLCIVASVIAVIAVLAIILGLLLNYIKDDSEKHIVSTLPSIVENTDTIDGRLHVIRGPFSVYRDDYKNRESDAFKSFSVSFNYKMKTIFLNSRYSSVYNHTVINSISSDSVVYFSIYFNKLLPVTYLTESSIQSLISSKLREGLIIVDSVIITLRIMPKTTTPYIRPDECQSITLSPCINATTYSQTKLPNIFQHQTQNEVAGFFGSSNISLYCYEYATDFWCSALNPECKNGNGIPPCRQYCLDVQSSCQGQPWPLDCSRLPDSGDPNVCRQNPYKPGKCIPVPDTDMHKTCRSVGFTTTAFPNVVGNINVNNMDMLGFLDMILSISKATKCYKYTELFACSVYIPKCSGREVVPNHIIPPCRRLCEEFKSNCFVFWEIFAMPWPTHLNCSALPDSTNTSVCIGDREAREPPEIRPCNNDEIQCDQNRCIPKSYLCDGYQDCQDNTDESICANCPSDQQRCMPVSNLCIDKTSVCDGQQDCYMAADEDQCVKLGNGSYRGTLLVHNAAGSGSWEEVCAGGWNDMFSKITCSQLGYEEAISFSEVTESTGQKSILTNAVSSAEADANLIQSYLKKSNRSSCPNQKVISLKCGNPVCGTRPAYYPSPLRVVNGEEVKPGTWPFLVELLGGPRKLHFCGAAVIGHYWVITAAHCIGAKNGTDGIYMNIGDTRRYAYSRHRQLRRAKAFYVHPGYSPTTVEHDIALIELEDPIFFNEYARPICLPDSGQTTPVGTRCYVAGWGRAGDRATEYEPALMQVNLDVVRWERCQEAIANAPIVAPFTLTKDMMCAGGGLDHDACSGDSGGPLLCPLNATLDTWKLTGIVSWGLGCAVPNVPGVYTEVQKYAGFIRNITRNEIIFP